MHHVIVVVFIHSFSLLVENARKKVRDVAAMSGMKVLVIYLQSWWDA